MNDTARIEIDCDAGTVTLHTDPPDLRIYSQGAIPESRARLIGILMMMDGRDLLSMSMDELQERHLKALRVGFKAR